MNSYRHTQHAPLCFLLYGLAVVFFALAVVIDDPPALRYVFLPAGAVILVLAASFHALTVADEGDHLRISFGPIPLFRRRVFYCDMEQAEVDRTTFLEGWGIHLSPRGGWVWNLWGRDCVRLQLKRGTLRIGSDDAENLAGFLQSKLARPQR